MNILKELKPFNKHLDNWKEGHGFSDTEALEKLGKIWDEFAEENKGVIYGSKTHKLVPTDLSCRGCVKEMLSLCYNWRIHERKNPDNGVYHKMIPNEHTIKKIAPENKLSKLKWNELLKLAKEKGVKTYRKKRPEIEKELNG